MQRRTALKYLPIAFAISASPEQLADIAFRAKRGGFGLVGENGPLMVALVDLILPATTTPSASEAGVPEFIELFVKDLASPPEREAFHALIDDFAVDCQKQYGLTFESLPPAAQNIHFGGLLQTHDEFCVQFKRLTITGYFTSQKGMTEALTYLPIPGSFNGCVQMKAETKSEASYF